MHALFRRTAAHAMTQHSASSPSSVAIIGGGPAGLMAAEVLSQAGIKVDLYDGMPSVGRKFLLAGVGGMNITHSEAYPAFLSRYAERYASGYMAWASTPLSAVPGGSFPPT
jgi:predicted flavoprotein YhiN